MRWRRNRHPWLSRRRCRFRRHPCRPGSRWPRSGSYPRHRHTIAVAIDDRALRGDGVVVEVGVTVALIPVSVVYVLYPYLMGAASNTGDAKRIVGEGLGGEG